MRGVSHDEQLRQFAQAGHDVRAVVPLPWAPRRWLAGTRIPDEEQDGAVVIAHPRYPRVPRALSRAGDLERRLFAQAAAGTFRGPLAPDVVMTQSVSLPGGLLGRLGRAAFVVTLHDHELYDLAPRSAALRAAIVRTLRGADCAVYVSEALRRHGMDLAGPHRAIVIPIGIETYVEQSPTLRRHFTVCTVTRLIARKGVDRLIRVFARFVLEHPDAALVIVGDGPERAALEELIRALGIRANVEMTGALDARGAQERIARSSVMALPSVRESLGAVYLEAMSLGVPALGTRGEGIDGHIEHGVTGILVPPGDDEALLAELRLLAAYPERAREIGAAGRRRFLAGPFSWRANVEAYLALFEELLAARATHTT